MSVNLSSLNNGWSLGGSSNNNTGFLNNSSSTGGTVQTGLGGQTDSSFSSKLTSGVSKIQNWLSSLQDITHPTASVQVETDNKISQSSLMIIAVIVFGAIFFFFKMKKRK